MIARVLLLACAALLASVASATAAPTVRIALDPEDGVRLGQRTTVSGAVSEGTSPLAGRELRLEVRRHPFKGRWKRRATTVTDAAGAYSFRAALDRNHSVRVRLIARPPRPGDGQYVVPETDTLSRARNAYVLPAFTLDFAQRRKNVIRITQVYSVPRDVRLSAPTRFYVGPCGLRRGRCTAKRAPVRAVAATKRVRAGRYRAAATIRIPARYKGRFQYVSCFGYSKGSGMGDPELRCPKRTARLR